MIIILELIVTLTLVSGTYQNKTDNMTLEQNYEIATLGSGCFWCTEAVFEGVKGVISVESGYSGGFVKNPSYREVCNGTTGHAEVVQVRFNPTIITYNEILEIFFVSHDPTSLNKQGADIGTQYRSVILYHNLKQKAIAEQFMKELTKKAVYDKPVVTQLVEFTAFYVAEKYHQDYFANNPNEAYCSYVIRPKLEKFRIKYNDMLK